MQRPAGSECSSGVVVARLCSGRAEGGGAGDGGEGGGGGWWMVMVEDGAAVPRAFWLADSVQEKRAQVKSLLVEDCPSSCR